MANQLNAMGMRRPVELDDELFAELQRVPTLKHATREDLASVSGLESMEIAAGETLVAEDTKFDGFWALLAGEFSLTKQMGKKGVHIGVYRAGETFGEVPLLLGLRSTATTIVAVGDCRLLRFPESAFWTLLAVSPKTRQAIQMDAARRFETYQVMTLHREKLISLGTLAAGLMHELNNPGSAARRASAQLRENITRMQHISLALTRTPFDAGQLECLGTLQERVLSLEQPASPFSSLEQSDREEELSEWLESIHVENPWRMAPTLVSVGWTRADVDCARHSFAEGTLSNALNYIEALISSMQQVNTIEESITRVTDLVGAVKKYAYDDKNKYQMVDVRDTLLSTLTILNHKFRHKGVHVERELPSAETRISCVGSGLTQVWTNLLDNAIDAAPEGGEISVRLWTEDDLVCVAIKDNGAGIPEEHWEHIFEPFYTTKEAGVGTGLGLDIAHRIVVGTFHGDIQFTSKPGETEFVVKLPMDDSAMKETVGCRITAELKQ